MAYIKKTWVDQEVERPKTYEMVNNSDGSVTLVDSFGLVAELGTPVNADNMNHIEEGIAAGSFTKFDLNTTYDKNDLVTVIEDGSPVIYKSLVDNNFGNALSSSIAWEQISLGGGGLEIGDIGIAPLGIDETKGKRRYLNGQVIIQEQYPEFTNKLKTTIATLPTIVCTEQEWQATVAMNYYGMCGQFVIDDVAGTIRLPKITGFIQGITDLTSLGLHVGAGLPQHAHTRGTMNITGDIFIDGQDTAFTSYGTGAFFTNGTFNAKGNGHGDHPNEIIGFDAARSWTGSTSGADNHIYGKSETVQPESILYPYFIQVATGAETEADITNEIELNNPFFFGMSQYFDIEPNNISWLKSAGQWNSKALYPSYYDWILANVNGGVEGFVLSTNTYTDYDFVINTANETFRLPLLDGSEDLPSDRYIDLTLNEDGSTYTAPANGWYFVSQNHSAASGFTYLANVESNFADTAKAVQSNSNTENNIFLKRGQTLLIAYTDVTATQAFRFTYAIGNGSLYFYVGETVQNANLINAGRIEEKISSLIPDNSSLISGYGMPTGKHIDLALGAGSTYVAPANGYFYIEKQSTGANQYISMVGDMADGAVVGKNIIFSTGVANTLYLSCPARKGERVTVNYNAEGALTRFGFYFAEGEV